MSKEHLVESGDCISSIALHYGLSADTIWHHPKNAKLKELRKDPDVLNPGDVVFIPDLTLKTFTGATDMRHRFVRKSVPAKFSLRLTDDEKPRSNLAYRLIVDGAVLEGKTDTSGVLSHAIPPGAQKGMLLIEETDESYELRFGVLDPVTEEKGVRQRLENLAYLRCGGDQEEFEAAIVYFKVDHCGMKLPDENDTSNKPYEEYVKIDQAVRDKLVEVHGS